MEHFNFKLLMGIKMVKSHFKSDERTLRVSLQIREPKLRNILVLYRALEHRAHVITD